MQTAMTTTEEQPKSVTVKRILQVIGLVVTVLIGFGVVGCYYHQKEETSKAQSQTTLTSPTHHSSCSKHLIQEQKNELVKPIFKRTIFIAASSVLLILIVAGATAFGILYQQSIDEEQALATENERKRIEAEERKYQEMLDDLVEQVKKENERLIEQRPIHPKEWTLIAIAIILAISFIAFGCHHYYQKFQAKK